MASNETILLKNSCTFQGWRSRLRLRSRTGGRSKEARTQMPYRRHELPRHRDMIVKTCAETEKPELEEADLGAKLVDREHSRGCQGARRDDRYSTSSSDSER